MTIDPAKVGQVVFAFIIATNIIFIITAGSFESSMKHILSLPQDLVFLKQTIFGIWDLPKTNQRMLAKYDCSQMVI